MSTSTCVICGNTRTDPPGPPDIPHAGGYTCLGHRDQQERLDREALAAVDRRLARHEPGDFHRYRTECEVCGQPGMLYVEMRPSVYEPRLEPKQFLPAARSMPDGSPCWCISEDEPHEGWQHAPVCASLRGEA